MRGDVFSATAKWSRCVAGQFAGQCAPGECPHCILLLRIKITLADQLVRALSAAWELANVGDSWGDFIAADGVGSGGASGAETGVAFHGLVLVFGNLGAGDWAGSGGQPGDGGSLQLPALDRTFHRTG